ncbi:hypothetical protein OS187_10705 [Xanthomonadaceae bacterium JHOS43]|nr:hypothetical protein [Xanthomonadaceae bacterium JHOS43]
MQRFTVYLLLALLAPVTAFADGYGKALAPLLEGEFALQQGDAVAAVRAYARAAEASDDPAVAERAVQVALNAQDAQRARRGLARWTTLAPGDANLDAGRLRLALLEQDETAARAPLEILLSRENGWRQIAAALISAPQHEVSVRLLGGLLDDDLLPDAMDAWLAFGGVALRLEDKPLYARLAQSVVQRFPDDARALAWQAEEAADRGDVETARRMLDAALALPGLSPGERLSLAAHLNALGDPVAAAKALESAGDDDRVLASRAAYLAQARDKAGLAALYAQAVAKTPERGASPARLMLLGQLAEMQEEALAALGWYRQIPGGVQREQAQLRIAVLLDRSGDGGAALDLLREIQASETEWGDIVRDAYLLEAELARGRGDGVAELSALDRGLSIFEDDTTLRYSRALAYERMDRVDEAVADLRALVALEPDEADFLNALGYTLVDRTDALEEGLALIEKAIALKPDSPAILDSLGWALHRLGRDIEALPHLRRAFEFQRDAEIGAHLAIVLAALGQPGEARSVLRLAQEIDPDNRALRRAVQALQPEAGGE